MLPPTRPIRLFAADYTMLVARVTGFAGTLLVTGGLWLIGLGGSWSYAFAGLGVLAVATLLMAHRIGTPNNGGSIVTASGSSRSRQTIFSAPST